ncbi:MAG: polysaccharide deacetylase family protein [Chloroflexi bacterium]|nr:polysaccharide deacetylase family protein [Chloroflexota bacterium]MCI0580129.1 polysaccharide deacetylase family protein [Chloroflexota bacterium]MCI0649295.1 polysaccharide deacetylase family protein [Chloroflexota bacterium]MCI0725972.1 polysaccharide deacetylase family protein [Chloroflexota bacterium]
MEEFDDNAPARPDGVSCVGILFLAALAFFILAALLGSADVARGRAQTTQLTAVAWQTMTRQALAAVTMTSTPSRTATATATATETATATATATSTLTPSPSHTASAEASETATDTPSPTATLEPTATATNTPTPPPLPTPNGTYSWTLPAPILMYHYISVPPEDADIYRTDLSVTPENFRAQMAYLVTNGYSTIDLYDLSLAIVNKRELPPKPVIITMDDGYRDNYENAFPVLKEFGLKATFFIVTEFVDQNNPAYMNWAMIEEMAAAGMRMEPHSKTHVDLQERDRDFLIWQILGSQETLAAHIGYRPRYFCYPGGGYDDNVITILQELEFWGAVTTAGGEWHGFNDRYEWTRLRVRNSTTLANFADLVG